MYRLPISKSILPAPIKLCLDTDSHKTRCFIQRNSFRISLRDMQLDRRAAALARTLLDAHQQLPGHAHPPESRQHLNRPDISSCFANQPFRHGPISRQRFAHRFTLLTQADNREACPNIVCNPNPCPAVRIGSKRPHQRTAEAHGRLEASLLDGVQRSQIAIGKNPRRHFGLYSAHDPLDRPQRHPIQFRAATLHLYLRTRFVRLIGEHATAKLA